MGINSAGIMISVIERQRVVSAGGNDGSDSSGMPLTDIDCEGVVDVEVRGVELPDIDVEAAAAAAAPIAPPGWYPLKTSAGPLPGVV